ncbi:uncharacterized protein [Miscanthus floridulus]|uniref:uncharacterized protein n=1 Tax=Miscanthus floridulus TaxID=154761 RepID=UPI00345A29E5
MRNSARLQQLGLIPSNPFSGSTTPNSQDKNKTKQRNREDSESNYEPDSVDDDIAKVVVTTICPMKMILACMMTTTPWMTQLMPLPNLLVATQAPMKVFVPLPCYSIFNIALQLWLVYVNCIFNDHLQPGRQERRKRGVNMGHGLHRINRSHRGKLPIVIPEGNIRPLVPLVAAKFASECNIAVRNHVPVLTHWKKYKKRPTVIDTFLGILRAKFDIDTNDDVVKHGCLEMMKSAVRQQRHKLKQQFFDHIPLHLVPKTSPVKSTSNEDWIELVELWKTPKKMVACQKNKDNRGNVSLHQTTGSRSYPVFVENLGNECEDEDQEPDAFDLFKLCHYSKKKKGFEPAVQSVITEMESQMAAQPQEGEQPKSRAQVVADVLQRNNKKSMFLQNVGMQTKRPRLTAQLETEKRDNVELRLIVSNQRAQVEDLSKQLLENEQIRIRDREEMSKKQAELEAKFELFLGQNRAG